MAHRDNVSRVYKDFHADDHSQVSQETTTGLWTGDTASLSEFHVSDGTGGLLIRAERSFCLASSSFVFLLVWSSSSGTKYT